MRNQVSSTTDTKKCWSPRALLAAVKNGLYPSELPVTSRLAIQRRQCIPTIGEGRNVLVRCDERRIHAGKGKSILIGQIGPRQLLHQMTVMV